jgi:Zn-dependent protease with chaperone function
MTDFFEQQDQARKATYRLIVLYVLGVIGTCVTLHFGLSAALSLILSSSEESSSLNMASFLKLALNPQFALFTLGITSLIIVLSSVYKMASLRAGGSVVARELGGREILNSSQDVLERRLLNVVEEMAIASGIAMPRVFVLDNEKGMNAFAAGFSSKDAAVAVTRGLLEIVQRDELQAVIGHEFSHVLNGDMRLNIRLVGILYGIFALAILGRVLIEIGLRSSSRSTSSKKNSLVGLAVVGIVCWLVGQIGFFFGRLIQSSISRQREFLADASAVQFTRNPLGLANALKLIGAAGSRLASPKTSEVSHMLFASGLESMFATHPPIVSRIRRLDNQFDGNFTEARTWIDKRQAALTAMASGAQSIKAGGSAEGLRSLQQVLPGASISIPGLDRDSAKIVGSVYALAWLQDAERESLVDPVEAVACICGALVANDDELRDRQMALLPFINGNEEALRQKTDTWRLNMRSWSVSQRRKTCELAVSGLRNESFGFRTRLATAIDAISRADDVIEPFEFAVGYMIRRRLLPDDTVAHALRAPVPPRPITNEIVEVLSVIALYGAKDETRIRPALEAGLKRLLPFIGAVEVRTINQSIDARKLDRAFQQLEGLAPLIKREFMQACEVIILHDGEILETEETFLFAIADAIDAMGWNATLLKKSAQKKSA